MHDAADGPNTGDPEFHRGPLRGQHTLGELHPRTFAPSPVRDLGAVVDAVHLGRRRLKLVEQSIPSHGPRP